MEQYALCKCIYYEHSIDPCPYHAKEGHKVTIKEVYVGYGHSRYCGQPRSDSGNEGTIDVHLQPPPIRLGYLLVLFGALTVAGSLAPAVWRCQADHDLSGGFALAQYILRVGVFVVGNVAAIHGRSCTCWQR